MIRNTKSIMLKDRYPLEAFCLAGETKEIVESQLRERYTTNKFRRLTATQIDAFVAKALSDCFEPDAVARAYRADREVQRVALGFPPRIDVRVNNKRI